MIVCLKGIVPLDLPFSVEVKVSITTCRHNTVSEKRLNWKSDSHVSKQLALENSKVKES